MATLEEQMKKVQDKIEGLQDKITRVEALPEGLERQQLTELNKQLTLLQEEKNLLLKERGVSAAAARPQPWFYSKLMAEKLGVETPWDQLTVYGSCAAGAGGFAHYWRKANALMHAKEAITHDPARAEELKAIWELTEVQLKKAAYHSARFRRIGVAAGMGVPLLFIGWARAKRASSKHD